MVKKAEQEVEEVDVVEDVENEEADVEEVESTDEGVTEEEEASEGSEEKSSESDDDNSEEGDDDEVIVTIGDQEPVKSEDDSAPEWVRELRKAHRETQRENRELKAKLEANQSTEKKIEVGAKPNLEDFDYDAEEFEKALTSWYERKREADNQAAELEREQKAQQEAWQKQLNNYGEAKSKLKVKDFDDAEATVLEMLDQTQQGIIVQGAENSALVVYALGKNFDRIKELSQIKDPVKFAFAVAKLEKDLKVKNRKAPPPPEKTVNGTGSKSGSVDSTLERLRAEAEKTGNYTKVSQYRRQQKQKAKR